MKLILSDDNGTVLDMWQINKDDTDDIGIFEAFANINGMPEVTAEKIKTEVQSLEEE